ncbi:AtMMH-1 [Obelidium mucronatum]|nr:AtMMH-1 [Obelidium mucronatum]
MPELPEVERARRLLQRLCVGRVFERITANDDAIVFGGAAAAQEFAAHTGGRRVVDTFRRGKVFGLTLDTPPHLVMHFGMTGNIVVKDEDATMKYKDFKQDTVFPPRFCKFVAEMDDGTQFAFADGRRLARIKLLNDPMNEPPISALGFDPLLDMPPLEEFSRLIRKRTLPIKNLLLDQSFSAGIGNWVADEVLYQAKIHPGQYTQTLLDTEISNLYDTIVSVIKIACDANADSELFPKTWLFHYRWFKGKRATTEEKEENDTKKKGKGKKQPPPPPSMPDGNLIEFETLGGRTSAFVPAVQVLRPLDEGQSPVKKAKKKTVGTPKSVSKKRRDKESDSERDETEDEEEDEEEEPAKRAPSKRNKTETKEDDAPSKPARKLRARK